MSLERILLGKSQDSGLCTRHAHPRNGYFTTTFMEWHKLAAGVESLCLSN